MPRSIKTQIFILIVCMLLAQLVLTLVLNFSQKEEMKKDIAQEISKNRMLQAGRLCRGAWLMCSLDYKHVRQTLESNLRVAEIELKKAGPLRAEGFKTYNVINAQNKEAAKITVPQLFFGNTPVMLNPDPNIPSPVVDSLNQSGDVDITIWQRMNEEGDMLRLSANWKTADGKRAVGTFQTADDAEWGPRIRDILERRNHYCNVLAVDKKFAALFVPLLDSNKRVVGMLGLGFSMKDIVDDIKSSLFSLQLGNKGYISILKAGGKSCGASVQGKVAMILGNHGTVEKGVWDFQKSAQEIAKVAVQTRDGNTKEVSFDWMEAGGSGVVSKTAAVTYFEPFDWVIFAGVNNNEFNAMSAEIDSNLDSMLYVGLGGNILLMAVAAIVAVFLLHRIIDPINRVVAASEVIATGNLVEASSLLPQAQDATSEEYRPSISSRETRALWTAMEGMNSSLRSLVQRVQNSSDQLLESAGNIRTTASSQKEAIADFEGHVSHIAAAIAEISATSQELSRTMSDIRENSTQAAELANTGKEGLHGMEQMLGRLSEETASISSRLAMINEKANNIDSMVITITKVAEQTNLLSLNAAIEAEKAGEYGLGFSVVAREIRRLADQTALATLDIEQMVEQMRSSVSQGVMEMERFTQDVRQSVTEGGRINQQLSTVITKVQQLSPRFERVSEGMNNQSQGARQISQSMVQLSDAAKELARTFEDFNVSSDRLRNEADQLGNEISRFRVE